MRTMYREKKYICNDFLEVDIYPVYKQLKGKRNKKAAPTSDVMKILNNHNKEKRLTRLLNTNFTEDDIKIELTYSDENLPETEEDAQKELQKFFRRLKRFRKKNNLDELKYIAVTERGKRSGRFHHHIVVNGGMLSKDIQNIWGNGFVRETPLQISEDGLDALAKYLVKNLKSDALQKGQKSWHASRNLKQPIERQNDSRLSRKKAKELHENKECKEMFEKLYPDYFLASCSTFYNDVNGGYYLCLNMYRKEQKKKSKGKNP